MKNFSLLCRAEVSKAKPEIRLNGGNAKKKVPFLHRTRLFGIKWIRGLEIRDYWILCTKGKAAEPSASTSQAAETWGNLLTYSLTHFGHLMFFISARGGEYLDWRFKL